ncbi:hypothetical protein [Paenibacillus amylolyticus]|uniref:hypothetical protein n=1 Tax=Paenibacillus amylolyticus TaxID=1451 RepID=UPI003D990651
MKLLHIDNGQAKKLGQIIEMLSEKGFESINRSEAIGHCIDFTYEMMKKHGSKLERK